MKVITGTFQNADGTPLAGARVWFRLSQDAVAVGFAQVAPLLVFFILDSTGSIPANSKIWFNDELSPSGTTYTVAVVAAGGGLAWGAESVSITGASFNLSSAVPTTSNVSFANPVVTNPTAQQTINGFDLVMEGANIGWSAAASVVGDIWASRLASNILGIGKTSGAADASLRLAVLQAADGAVGSPSISFTSDLTSGLYRIGASRIGLSLGGVNAVDFQATLTKFNSGVVVANSFQASLSSQDVALSRATTNTYQIGVTAGTPDASGMLKLSGIGINGQAAAANQLSGLTKSKQIFTGNGTFTIPTGVTSAKVTVVGGGAGGGGSAAGTAGGGGGAGGTAVKWLTGLTPANTIAVTVGGGGAGNSNAIGSNGNNSSIASGTQTITTVTGGGGNGGTVGAIGVGGNGGTCTNGDLNITGSDGDNGFNVTTNGGQGGASTLGGAGRGASGAGGQPGYLYGGGGGGSQGATFAGGAGAAGVVIFEWVV